MNKRQKKKLSKNNIPVNTYINRNRKIYPKGTMLQALLLYNKNNPQNPLNYNQENNIVVGRFSQTELENDGIPSFSIRALGKIEDGGNIDVKRIISLNIMKLPVN